MRCFFVVGEHSGDLHASQVVSRLKILEPDIQITGWGGPLMAAAGANILMDYREAVFMGFWEVVKNLYFLKRRQQLCRKQMLDFRPDVVVLVDLSGFNLPLAKAAHAAGIPVVYYIAPKVWAWNAGRIRQIRRYVSALLVIFPFEEKYFRDRDIAATYVGNPVLEHFTQQEDACRQKRDGRQIAFLPGSRPQEISKSIPMILQIARNFPDFEVQVAGVNSVDETLYTKLAGQSNVAVFFGKTYKLLMEAEVAVITSGTATLEGALAGVPQVVVYRTSWLTYVLAKMLIRIPFISLVNILLGRRVVSELIQQAYNPERLTDELNRMLMDPSYKKRISEGYSEIRNILGNRQPSIEVATIIQKLRSS